MNPSSASVALSFRREHATCLQGLLTCKTCADGDPSIALAKAAQGLMSGI